MKRFDEILTESKIKIPNSLKDVKEIPEKI